VPALTGLADKIRFLAQFKERPVGLRQLLELAHDPSPARLLASARFLHQELPVRIAHRFRELQGLPGALAETSSVERLREMYLESLAALIEMPAPVDDGSEEQFTRLIDRLKQRHGNVVLLLGRAILELRQTAGVEADLPAVQEVLDRFLTARIGIRMLIGQHVAVHGPRRGEDAGLLSERCSPAAVAMGAIAHARHLSEMHHGVAPGAIVCGDPSFIFTYVPAHLHHMVLELVKNSMRAVVERHGGRANLPRIRVVVAEGKEDVTIKISDEGGGIPRSDMGRLWTYFYTTAPPQPPARGGVEFVPPFAGLGFGLPLVRLHARYFGGDLEVISMEGFGTDACLYLRRLDATEVLPGRVRPSPAGGS
jgi:pyruvate dehydrogenase kinase 2/3/4